MTDDLVKRLNVRAAVLHASASWGSDADGVVMNQAADRIEALTAENERLREALEALGIMQDTKYRVKEPTP